MATQHLAEKFESKVDERFHFGSYTDSMASKAYTFDGVKGIYVYSIDTPDLVDYTRSGTSRYGTPAELTDSLQYMEMTQDKSSTWTIDKGNQKEQFNIKKANESTFRFTNEKVVPWADKYTFKKWINGAGTIVNLANAMNANNVIAAFNDCTEALDNKACPEDGRTCVIKNSKYKLLKQAPQFMYTEKLAGNAYVKGKVGEIDGMDIKPVPDAYLPAGVDMLIVHKSALLRPEKLKEYKIHADPPGINGNLVEFRLMMDAFVLDAKAGAVCVVTSDLANVASGNITIAGDSANGVTIKATDMDEIWYTLDGSDPRCSGTAVKSNANVTVAANAALNGAQVRAFSYTANKTCAYGPEATATIA